MQLSFTQTQAAALQTLATQRANLQRILDSAAAARAREAEAAGAVHLLEEEKAGLIQKQEALFSDTTSPAEEIGEKINVIQNAVKVVERRIKTAAEEEKEAGTAWCRAAGRTHICAKTVINEWCGLVARARTALLTKLVQGWEPTAPQAPGFIQYLAADSAHFTESLGSIQTLSYLRTVDGGAQLPTEAPMVLDIAERTLEITANLHEATPEEEPVAAAEPESPMPRRKLIPDRKAGSAAPDEPVLASA